MSQNPYSSQEPNHFWSTAVRQPIEVGQNFDIEPLFSEKNASKSIASAGSCFAQYVGKELSQRGLNFHKSSFSSDRMESFGIGNAYTSKQFRQWLEFAIDKRQWSENSMHENKTEFSDYLLPHLASVKSKSELINRRKDIAAEIKKTIAKTNILIFTLGLTECWLNEQEDVYPACPGTLVGEFDENSHFFKNLEFEEVSDDLVQIETLLETINPDIELVLTVSPVPLTATASADHVMIATNHSKSILRAAASRHIQQSAKANYFPSYELMTHNSKADWRFDDNLRNVSPKGVEFVMKHAFGDHVSGLQANEAPRVSAKSPEEVACEEQLLETYNRLGETTNATSNIALIGDSHLGKLSEAMTAMKLDHIGGMIMNGSGFSDGKFELCEEKLFKPLESVEAAEIWDVTFERLSKNRNDNIIYTNIGFQTHRTPNDICNHFQSPFLTKELTADYFKKSMSKQVNLLKMLGEYGQVVMVEDPYLYPFRYESRSDQIICNIYNFDIYCSHIRALAQELGFIYLKPCEKIVWKVYRETGNIGKLLSNDTFHGSDLYYQKLAEIFITKSVKIISAHTNKKAA